MKRISLAGSIGVLLLGMLGCSTQVTNGTQTSDSSSAKETLGLNLNTNLPKVSVQLWSVKNQVSSDFKGTLRELAKMGFQGVEFAGEFGEFANNPAGLKQFLSSLGLEVSGAHIHFDKLTVDKFVQTVEFYRAIGTTLLIVPYDERAFSPNGVEQVVSELTALAKKLAPFGMQIGYHNHDKEFDAYQGTTYWDYIAQSTSDDVVLQQDVGWTTYAGKDPVEYVRRYPGRTVTTHYKVRLPEGTEGKLPIIGQDTIDWPALIKANIEVGGTRWLVVEQEEYPNGLTPLQTVALSKKGLDAYLLKF
jgi:sugar phosphate isomerase/epimerase